MNNAMKNKTMSRLQVLSVAVALALTSAAVFAQSQQASPDRVKAHMQLDTNKDGVIDRTEAAKAPKLTARFDQLDTNKDGKLSADEIAQMRGKHRRGAMGGDHGRMMALDIDKDGRISRAEAQAGKDKLTGRFDQMDVNKDGYLDEADMQAKQVQRRAEFFNGADTNRDGRVTRDEFIVEQGARSAERREQWAKRASSEAGEQKPARPVPTAQQQIDMAGKVFDRMDANKDGALTHAEFDAFKPERKGMRDGMHRGTGNQQGDAKVPAPKS